ncbi:MAG: NAD(P)-dependent oxidoreductase [Candidatus Sumerlaeia bacterium]
MNITVWVENEIDQFCFRERHKAIFEERIDGARVTRVKSQDDFLKHIEDAHLTLSWRFQEDWLAKAPKLRLIACPAAGREGMQFDPPEGVSFHFGAYHGKIMAETCVGMILASCRGILDCHATQDEKAWDRVHLSKNMTPIRGSHIAIVGFGSIGQHIARLLRPFEPRLTGFRRSKMEKPQWLGPQDRILTMDDFDKELPHLDHLVMVVPGGEDTDNMLDRKRLARLPEHAVVYNLGRGNAIDESALAEILNEGKIARACLDVFEQEPLPEDAPIRKAPNVLIMPHVSAVSPDYLDLCVNELCDYVLASDLAEGA